MTLPATSRRPIVMHDQRDLLLRERLLVALRNSGYGPLARLDCLVKDGVVELSGYVSSFYLKQLAQSVAMRFEDTRGVRNRVVVADRECQLPAQALTA